MFRTRRILKWAGLAACLLIAAAWVGSIFAGVVCQVGKVDFAVGLGFVGYSSYAAPRGAPRVELIWFTQGVAPRWEQMTWLPEWSSSGPGILAVWIPLWIPLLIVATPTFIAWRLDRRYPPGHCQRCGYDLTGNVSGRCPECGWTTNRGEGLPR
ncbi:MAG: hypothetical protein V3W34_20045 [Phycisphaerae bacterium]